jgi:hypothetical protein
MNPRQRGLKTPAERRREAAILMIVALIRGQLRGRCPPRLASTLRPVRFCCISDNLPDETPRLLREACRHRHIEFLEIDAAAFDFDPGGRLGPGDLLFRPSASLRSQRVEQFLYAAGVATLYRRPDDLFRDVVTPRWVLERAGIRMPKGLFCSSGDRLLLQRHVEALGGFPVVVKLGGEAGRGTMLFDSWPALFSFFDYNRPPLMPSLFLTGRFLMAPGFLGGFDSPFMDAAPVDNGDA